MYCERQRCWHGIVQGASTLLLFHQSNITSNLFDISLVRCNNKPITVKDYLFLYINHRLFVYIHN